MEFLPFPSCLLKFLSSERREAPQANLSSVFSNLCPLNYSEASATTGSSAAALRAGR
ncbi:MAG: hypothetical protein LBD06_03175 [Candidatus Accumulibacter sp.]|nr:hypothetical protein [Accumulibacter sp.]